MIGTTGKNVNPFDSNEFGKLFFEAFGVRVSSYSISNDGGSLQNVNAFGAPVSSYVGFLLYIINVTCIVNGPASSTHWMLRFQTPHRGHILQSVKTTHDHDIHKVEMTYRTGSLDEFMRELGNISYKRFSDKFHEDLDKVLEEEAD